MLQWTTRRASTALLFELGRDEDGVGAVAVLPDGRVVTGSRGGGRVLVWDPAEPGAGPAELGRDMYGMGAAAVLPDGRVGTGVGSGRVLVWDPAGPGTGPAELGGGEISRALSRPGLAGVGGGGAAGRAGSHRRRRRRGCWCGTRPSRASARSSSAATRSGWGRWRCCRTGGWSPAATTRPGAGVGPG